MLWSCMLNHYFSVVAVTGWVFFLLLEIFPFKKLLYNIFYFVGYAVFMFLFIDIMVS